MIALCEEKNEFTVLFTLTFVFIKSLKKIKIVSA